jgi:hypothetical protein
MLGNLPRPSLSLDPLIAEAKRRARQRRFVVALAVVVLAGGAVGAVLALNGQSGSAARGPVSSPPAAAGSASVGPAVRLATCASPYQGRGCRSPDDVWSILISSDGTYCTLSLRHGTGVSRQVYNTNAGDCGEAVWVKSDRLLFEAGGNGRPYRVLSLDATSGKVNPVANFLGYVVSANERWFAGELRPKGSPPLVAVVSLRNHACRVVTQAGPNGDVIVAPGGGVGMLGGDGVGWRPNGRVRVASGPGVGFTRDSKGVIVAVDRWSSDGSGYYRKLVRFPLSAARTPCPAVVTAPSPKSGALGSWPYPKPRRGVSFFPLTLHASRTGHRITSLEVTVNGYVHDAIMQVKVLRGSPLGIGGPAANHPAVFTEQVRMTNLPSHGDVPPRTFPLATWSGTLSPGDWRGGCQKKQYEVWVRIRPATPSPVPQGEDLGSPWFRCSPGQ